VDPPFDHTQWNTLLAVLVTFLVVVYVLQRKDFVIRARPGRFECWGRFALAHQQALAGFLQHDLKLRGPIKIMGKWLRGRMRVSFRGPLTPGEQQRIRNFLANLR
jgi:hypothetical protein